MSPYRSLMPTDRPTALGNLLTPMAEGFASGLNEDRLRRRNLEDQVTTYRTLMPLQLEMAEKAAQLKQRYTQHPYTPIPKGSRFLMGPNGLIQLPQEPDEGPSGLLGLLGKNLEVPQNPSILPANPILPTGDRNQNYGAGEEAANGTVPATRTMPGNEAIVRLLGMDPMQHEVVPHIGVTGITASIQKLPKPTAETSEWETRQRNDGSLVQVNKKTGEVRPTIGGEALKTAQPWTSEMTNLQAVADKFPDWKPGQPPSPAHAKAAAEFGRVQIPANRLGAQLEAQADRVQLISNIAEAKALGGLTDDVIRQRSKQTNAIQGVMNRLAQDKAYQGALGRLKAELAEDETGTPLGAKLQEIRTSGKPLSGTAASDVVRYNQYLRAANLLRKEFTNAEILKYVGYGRFQAKQLEQFIVTDPRFMRFMTLNEQLRGTAFGEGGKQLTPFEASVVFGYTPTGREAWGEYYLAKMDEIIPRFEMLIRETMGAQTTPRGKYVPSQVPKENHETVTPSSVDPLDGRTATGPNGEKIIRRNGTWQPLK